MFQTPDITKAQVVSIVGALIGVIVAAGVPMSDALQTSIIALVTVLAAVLLGADAHIRNGRAKGSAQK